MPPAAERLDAAGVETPRLDAELLLASALGITRSELYLRPRGEPLSAVAAARFEELVARRAAREPVAYILGRKAFRFIDLDVDPRVLIPRPETELLVEVGLELPDGARVADVGTGSGAIALALCDERPDLRVTGIDASADALVVARANGVRLSLSASFVEGDLLVGGPYDAVLANLPYVRDGDSLPDDVARYEPAEALYGGPDGLSVIRRLVAMAGAEAVPLIALEVGLGQAEAVSDLLRAAGFGDVSRRRDLAGIERVVIGRAA